MSKGSRKVSGFLWAMVIAVVSFFIIYLFFPDFSNRYLGVSLKDPKKVGAAIENAGANVKDAATDVVSNAVETATDAVSNAVGNVVNNVVNNAVTKSIEDYLKK